MSAPAWADLGTAQDAVREGHDGSYLRLALQMYDVGGGTVDELAENWNLSAADRMEFLAAVKRGWAEERWKDRRVQQERRSP